MKVAPAGKGEVDVLQADRQKEEKVEERKEAPVRKVDELQGRWRNYGKLQLGRWMKQQLKVKMTSEKVLGRLNVRMMRRRAK